MIRILPNATEQFATSIMIKQQIKNLPPSLFKFDIQQQIVTKIKGRIMNLGNLKIQFKLNYSYKNDLILK